MVDNPFLAGLPAPTVVEEIDFEAVLAAMEADLVERFPEIEPILALESSATKKNLEAVAYRETLLRARVNDAARANLLAFATGGDLDHVGANAQPPVARMLGEDDERYRERILLSGMARNAGSYERYKLVALNTSLEVKDALPYREGRDPTVNVAILATTVSGQAPASLLNAVKANLELPENLVVNGPVNVLSAVSAVVDITASLVLNAGVPASTTANAEAALRAAWAAEGGLGRDLTVDWIKARLMIAGVYSAAVAEPVADVVMPPHEAASIGTVTLTVAGENT